MAAPKKEQKAKSGMVQVKILRAVGQHTIGSIVEVSDEIAGHLCAIKSVSNGEKAIKFQNAMLLSDYEEMKQVPVDKGGFTQGELAAMGEKNVVKTPKDPAFEARLNRVQANAEKAQKKQAEKDAAVAKDLEESEDQAGIPQDDESEGQAASP